MRIFLGTFVFLLSLGLIYVQKSAKSISSPADYNAFLESKSEDKYISAKSDFHFWQNKCKAAPHQYPYLLKMSQAKTAMFSAKGEVQDLVDAGNIIQKANTITNRKNAGILRALAKNSIAQHKFRKALNALETAAEIGEGLDATTKMLFDVYLELGETDLAFQTLHQIKDTTQFDYLIRLAKWEDHQGDLKTATRKLEEAAALAERSKNEYLMQWAYTNLADFYGHGGRISEAYSHYLKALELDPSDAYAKKGIAWIVYSFENKPKEAQRILQTISKDHESPEYALFEAEIAEFIGDHSLKNQHINAYFEKLKKGAYGDMYNKYSIQVWAEEEGKSARAIALAKKEVQARPTPQSFGLLAWTLFHAGQTQTALGIVEEKIFGKSFEPELLYQMAEIYKANHKTDQLSSLKEELKGSEFELGPLLAEKIARL